MSESAALAKALAAQLGTDLDRILGSESSDTPVYDVAEAPSLGSELRQVAGLNAGFTKALTPGTHHFGTGGDSEAGDARTKPFTVTVDTDHRVWFDTDVNVRLDGIVTKTRTALERQVIDAGSARFVVGKTKPPTRRRGASGPRARTASAPAPRIERIRVAKHLEVVEPRKRRFGLRSADVVTNHTESPLIEQILAVRSEAVRYERDRCPDPGQLRQMAMAGNDHMGHLEQGDDGFAVAPIAYGDLTWRPPLDRPDHVPAHLVAEVQQHSLLPSVPLFADLKNGHLGIVGDRASCLAVVRQIAITLRVLSPSEAISFSLLCSDGGAPDWAWLDGLPGSSGIGMPVMFFDGMRQVTGHGMRQELLETGTGGAIIIDDQLRDIPSICATVLEIQPSGTASLLDFRRGATTTRVATPLGFDPEMTNDFIGYLSRI